VLRSSLTSKRRDVVPGSRLTNGIETSCSGPEPHYDSGIATSCPGRIEMSCSGPVSQAASRCRAQVPLTSNLLSPSTPPPGWHKEGLWGSCLTRMRILRSREHHNYSIRHLAQQPCDSQLAFGGVSRVRCRLSTSLCCRPLRCNQLPYPLPLWRSLLTSHRAAQLTLAPAALEVLGRSPWPFRESHLPFPVVLPLPIRWWRENALFLHLSV
jgi:hypothetical protein